MTWGAIGGAAVATVGGALLSGGSSDPSSTVIEQTSANPFDATTSLTESSWDSESLNVALDPRLIDYQDASLGMANEFVDEISPQSPLMSDLGTGFLTELGTFDPYQAAADQYNLLSPELLADQEQDYYSLEDRLYSQGRLGSTGGSLDINALMDSQYDARAQMLYDAWAQAQATQQQLYGIGTGLSTTAPALQGLYSDLSSTYLNNALTVDQSGLSAAALAGGLAGAANTSYATVDDGQSWSSALGAGLLDAGISGLGNIDWGSFGSDPYIDDTWM